RRCGNAAGSHRSPEWRRASVTRAATPDPAYFTECGLRAVALAGAAAALAPPDRRIASRLRSSVLSPMPLTWRRSSADLNAPCESRYATIACALLMPMPSSELAMVVASAWLMSTGVAARAGRAQARVSARAATRLRIMVRLLVMLGWRRVGGA